MNAFYTFLPWLRRGLGNSITQSDGNLSATGRPSITVGLKLSDNIGSILHTHSKDVSMLGPGDLVGFNPNVVIKVMPQNGSSDFEPNYLPFIEFYDEDFPWRYSPAIQSNNRLRPWIVLITLKEEEFILNTPSLGSLPSITLKSDIQLPFTYKPMDQAWAWAHVHINSALVASETNADAISIEVDNLLNSNPDVAYSRILSPRRLEENTKYFAFLIPYFMSGNKAGLGEENPYDNIATQENILLTQNSNHPVYYSWSFATSSTGDIEELIRRLQPYNAADLKLPTLEITDLIDEFNDNSSFDSPTLSLDYSAALMPPGYIDKTTWPIINNNTDRTIKEALRVRLNAVETSNYTEDPVVNIPPIYGRWHAAIDELLEENTGSGGMRVGSATLQNSSKSAHLELKKGVSIWYSEPSRPWIYNLNLDPRFRAIAGLGTQVIQKNQEKFMDDAWEQVNSILEANQLLRQTQMALEVNNKILEKHISPRTGTEHHALTSFLHKKILAPNNKTISYEAKTSKISSAGFDPGLKKISRPGGKIAQKTASQMFSNSTTINFRAELVRDLDRPDLENVTGAVIKPAIFEVDNLDNFISLNPEEINIQIRLSKYITPPNNLPKPWEAGSFANTNNDKADHILNALQPENTLGKRILQRVPIPNKKLTQVKPIMAAPEFHYPMNEFLKALSGEYLIPGLSEFPNNVVTLLEPNRPYIEAFMAGLNHEMARELLWREYPSDQRGSYFRQFWNARDFIHTSAGNAPELTDISFMHTWNKKLGEHIPADSLAPGLCLVFRGDLFRKFPNIIIFAQKAEYYLDSNDFNKRRLLENGEIKYPLNKSLIEPDINIVGFDLLPDEANGDVTDAGWFFIFQERLGEARFGLDANSLPQDPTSWDGLDWAHLNSTNGIDTNPLKNSITSFDGVSWGENAAHMAYILYQAPVMLAIHASDFMPPKPPIVLLTDETEIINNQAR